MMISFMIGVLLGLVCVYLSLKWLDDKGYELKGLLEKSLRPITAQEKLKLRIDDRLETMIKYGSCFLSKEDFTLLSDKYGVEKINQLRLLCDTPT